MLLDQTKREKKWVTIIPLIAETVWRRADTFSSRGGEGSMRISYEDTEEKQKWSTYVIIVLLFFTCRIQLLKQCI